MMSKLIRFLKKNQKTVTFDSLATTEIEQFVESGLIDINIENLAIAFSDIEFPITYSTCLYPALSSLFYFLKLIIYF